MDTFTRRSLLGASVAVAASLAGCGGDSETDTDRKTDQPTTTATATATATVTDTPTTTATGSQPDSLALEHVRFCTEQPTGYRDYTEQPESTYRPEDTMWIYLEPSTVGTEPAGEGEVRFAYELTWTVHTPAGEPIDTITRTVEKTVASGEEPPDVFLTMSFSPPMTFEPGAHEIEIDVRDLIAGTEASTTVEFVVERTITQADGSFGIPEIVFLEEEAAGYDDYTPKPDGEYGPTERVWYYYEIDGVHYEETETALLTDLTIIETVTGPEGDVWNEAEIPITNEYSPDTDLSTLFVTDYITPVEEWLPGTYTIALEVTDGYTGETVDREGTFSVVE